MSYLIPALIAYLIGSFPTAFLIVKFKYGKNVFHIGSGNMGATNVLVQTESKLVAVIVGFIDILKGWLACWLMFQVNGDLLIAGLLGGSFAILGHNYSIIMGFKGGKGVATSIGALIFINPWSALIFTLVSLINRLIYFKFKFCELEVFEVISSFIITCLMTYWLTPSVLLEMITFKSLNLLKYITNNDLKKKINMAGLSKQFKLK